MSFERSILAASVRLIASANTLANPFGKWKMHQSAVITTSHNIMVPEYVFPHVISLASCSNS